MVDKEGPQAPPTAQGAHGPLAPQNPPPLQNPQIPLAPNAPQAPEQHTPHVPLLNWSHFKPKFSGEPDKDTEAHLLRTNDWMDTHVFPNNVKAQSFCWTLTGEARLWYESLRLLNIYWLRLQNIFRQQYSKIGNTREQPFNAWRSFHFNENVETIDAYVYCIRQVGTLLGYQEPQILEVFKNSLLKKLYWVLFPIMDLRQAVDTAKRLVVSW